jgi:hypothetical protein
MSYPEIRSVSEKPPKGASEVDSKYGDISGEPDSIGVIAPQLPELPESDSEKGHVVTEGEWDRVAVIMNVG